MKSAMSVWYGGTATVTYHFDRPTIVNQLEIIEHYNGTSKVEGFVGNERDMLSENLPDGGQGRGCGIHGQDDLTPLCPPC